MLITLHCVKPPHRLPTFVVRNFFFFNFPTVQQGGHVILTCIHYNYIFPPPIVLLQHECLDIVLNAILSCV